MNKNENPTKHPFYQRFSSQCTQWIINEWSWIFSVIFIFSWIGTSFIQLTDTWLFVINSSIFFFSIFIFLIIFNAQQSLHHGVIENDQLAALHASNDDSFKNSFLI